MVRVKVGPIGASALSGMRRAIAAMADEGNDLIVDDAILNGEARYYRDLLLAHQVFVVGVRASLRVLEQREAKRPERLVGLARAQYRRVHEGVRYDFEVNTDNSAPAKCAKLIKAAIGI
jgi:chloramphenicol 3-O phosphotransferase